MLNQEMFNKIFIEHDLNAFNEYMEAFRFKVIEDTLCKLPEVMIALQVKTQGINKIYSDFFTKHPNLADKKLQVAELVQAIEMEDGSQTLEAILLQVPSRLAKVDQLTQIPSITDIKQTKEITNGFI